MPFKTKFSSTDSQIKTSFSQKETEFDSGLDEEARVGAIVVDIEKLKKEDELLHLIPDLVKETKKGTLKWKVVCQTTEYNDISKKQSTIFSFNDFISIYNIYNVLHNRKSRFKNVK